MADLLSLFAGEPRKPNSNTPRTNQEAIVEPPRHPDLRLRGRAGVTTGVQTFELEVAAPEPSYQSGESTRYFSVSAPSGGPLTSLFKPKSAVLTSDYLGASIVAPSLPANDAETQHFLVTTGTDTAPTPPLLPNTFWLKRQISNVVNRNTNPPVAPRVYEGIKRGR